MKFPNSYFEDEVRDGYYVDALMKCCWAAQEEILNKIDEICRKYDIQYFAEWGTLLGTVRHGGFIPWDDDMDISMKRPDYNKFLKVAEAELPDGYHIMNYRNDGEYWDVMSRVVNTQAIRYDDEFLEKNHEFPYSTGIDIFPMDFLPTSESEAAVLKDLVSDVKSTADTYGAGYLSEKQFNDRIDQLEVVCNRKISREGDIQEHLYDIVVSLYALYHEDESEQIALMPLWLESGIAAYPKEYYQEAIRLPFDRITIPVPIAYDPLLKMKYGDYMKMVRKGGSHDYPYYKKQMKIMEEHGLFISEFKYKDAAKREGNRTSDFGSGVFRVLENVHSSLVQLLYIHNYEMALQLLSNCQQCAVTFGNEMEKLVPDATQTVEKTEEYCELIYQIYQALAQNEELNMDGVYQLLQNQLELIKEQYELDYKKKRKVVFIIDKASHWNTFDEIWKKEKAENNSKVVVIVVPYCYKRIDGTVLEEHYEKDIMPDYVDAVDYTDFDLEKFHPDTIYINSPYDEYNYFSNIYPSFYSSKLVNYTDELIYIPWFTITELTREDERGWQSMQHFVTMPGVVNADKVWVQSEQMKNTYIDYLTDWAGEETRTEWEQKIECIDSKYVKKENSTEQAFRSLPDIWKKKTIKEDGSRKKIVLYTVSGTGFAEYGMEAAEKMKYVLQTFKDNQKDITLLWYPDKMIEPAIRFAHPELWQAYNTLVQQYQQEDWGIYAEGMNEQTAAAVCDAYYGDPGKLSQAVVVMKKPVMLQNVTITE